MAIATSASHHAQAVGWERPFPFARLLLAILADGPAVPRPAGFDSGSFLHWNRRNKLPLLAVAERLPDWLATDAVMTTELDAEQAWYALQREEYLAVEAAWRARGIECLMIKSAGNAPSFPHTSDNIDVLVRSDQGRAARDVLRALGYVELRNVEEPQKFLFRRYRAGHCVSAIHVHERIAWFVGFLDDADVWRGSGPADDDPRVTVPAPEDAVLINLAHACYENKELRLLEMLRVRHALESAGVDFEWPYVERVAARYGWLDGLAFMALVHAAVERSLFGETLIPRAQLARFRSVIAADLPVSRRLAAIQANDAGDMELPLDLSYRLCKRLYYRKILRDPARRWPERGRDVAATLIWGIRLKSGLRPQPGMIVSLSGPDGAGKTAHAERLVAALRQCEIKAGYCWSRGGSTGLLGSISRLRRCLNGSNSTPEASDRDAIARRRLRLRHPLARFGWAWLVALDQLGTYWWRAYLPARLGRVVIADRYIYDAAIEIDMTLPADAGWSRLALRAMLALAPRPTLGYLLDVSLGTAQARKPEEAWHASWKDERRRYQHLAARHGLRLVSTEGSFAESSDVILREAIMTFMARYETRLNGLLYSNPRQKNEPDPVWLAGGAA